MSEGSTSSDDPQGYHHRFLTLAFDKSSGSERSFQNDYRITQGDDIGNAFDRSTIIEESVSSDDSQGYRRRFFHLNLMSSPASTIEKSHLETHSHSDSSFNVNDEFHPGSPINTGDNADSQEDKCISDNPNQTSILGQQELSSM